MYKVRVHLAKGVNYQKWQVTDLETKEVYYFDPKSVSLEKIVKQLPKRYIYAYQRKQYAVGLSVNIFHLIF